MVDFNPNYLPSYFDSEPDRPRLVAAIKLARSDPVQAVSIFERLANNGSRLSMIYIAEEMYLGTSLQMDLDNAEGWYRLAANSGLVHGSYGIGKVLEKKKKFSESVTYFQDCTDRKFAPAMTRLGTALFFGRGCTVDRVEAKRLWLNGAKLGNLWSKRCLAKHSTLGDFGIENIPFGVAMYVSGAADVFDIVWNDLYRDRLR